MSKLTPLERQVLREIRGLYPAKFQSKVDIGGWVSSKDASFRVWKFKVEEVEVVQSLGTASTIWRLKTVIPILEKNGLPLY